MSFIQRASAWTVAAAPIALAGMASAADAQSVESFYAGKIVHLIVGSAPAGAYDVYARKMAPYLSKYVPGNPVFIIENKPGGGGLLSSNYLYNIAPKDGSVIGLVERAAAQDPVINAKLGLSKFDSRKFNWIGSPTQEVGIGILHLPSSIKSWDDLKTNELIVSSTTSTASSSVYPRVLNGMFGTKFKLVQGYAGSVEALVAVDKGEVQGYLNGASSGVMRAQISPWIAAGSAKVFMLLGLKRDAAYPDAMMVMDHAQTDEDKQLLRLMFAQQVMAYPVVAPPNVPKERVDALRKAFDSTMTDPDFIADCAKSHMVLDPVSADEITQLVNDMYATPPAVLDRYAKLSTVE